jgi:O-methyltransferase
MICGHMYKDLLTKHSIISDQVEKIELKILLRELESVIDAGIDGDVVEFGCYIGTTSLFIQRLLLAKKSSKKFYVYDSFDGLPDKSKEDESPLGTDFKRGVLRSTKAEFIHNFRKANLPLPIIKKAWFHEVEDYEVPGKICFAFLDGDFYKSIRASLLLVKDKMATGSVMVVDDYDNSALPGAKKAVDLLVSQKSMKLYSAHSVGVVKWS